MPSTRDSALHTYESLCPFIADHPTLGRVSWNERVGSFEAGAQLLGSRERVPILVHRDAGDPTELTEATTRELFDRAARFIERVVSFGGELQLVGKERAEAELEEGRTARLGSVHVHRDYGEAYWVERDSRGGAAVGVELGEDGRPGEAFDVQASFRLVPSPIAEWLYAVPVHVDHAALGRMTLAIRAAQYVGMRTFDAAVPVRVDLRGEQTAESLRERLDCAAVIVDRIADQYDAAKGWTVKSLEASRTRRGVPTKNRLVPFMLALLADGTASLLFNDTARNAREAMSASFDRSGELNGASVSAPEEATEAFPVPKAKEIRRVSHPKLGEGEIVEDLDDGKVRVRFDDGSVRVFPGGVLVGGQGRAGRLDAR